MPLNKCGVRLQTRQTHVVCVEIALKQSDTNPGRTMQKMMKIRRPSRCSLVGFLRDNRGMTAVEFALILPIMLMMFFGTVSFSMGVAASRKVTQVASTLADLTAQSKCVNNASGNDSNCKSISDYFAATQIIMTPYTAPSVVARVSELYIDTTGKAYVQWSEAQGEVALAQKSLVTIPQDLAIPSSYLIFSEVSYLYKPPVDYVSALKSSYNLSDVSYTRPRYSDCVAENSSTAACTTLTPTGAP